MVEAWALGVTGRLLALTVATTLLSACAGDDSVAGGSTDSGGTAAKVVAPLESGPPGSGRWVVTVRLSGSTVSGSEVVQVAFDETQLSCVDGRSVAPSDVAVGTALAFDRVGNDFDAMEPPVIAGTRLRVDC